MFYYNSDFYFGVFTWDGRSLMGLVLFLCMFSFWCIHWKMTFLPLPPVPAFLPLAPPTMIRPWTRKDVLRKKKSTKTLLFNLFNLACLITSRLILVRFLTKIKFDEQGSWEIHGCCKVGNDTGPSWKYRKKCGANMLLERVTENWNHYLLLFCLFNR